MGLSAFAFIPQRTEGLVGVSMKFWAGKRVLLTGHTGFKGAWLSCWLSQMGAEVHGYALEPPTVPSLFEIASVRARLSGHTIADIRDLSAVNAAFAKAKAEIVIHFAAQPLVIEGYSDPVGTYAANVMGTVHVLDAVRRSGDVRVCLSITTDKCYENKGWVWGYRENDRLGGYDPYSNSKACAELVASAYRSSFFDKSTVAMATARAGNVIGGGDWAKNRLIPDLVQAFATGKVPVIRSPHAVRPWQHVLEPLSGYLMMCQALWEEGQSFAEGWNFGPLLNDTKPVSWIADRLVQVWGEGSSWKLDDNPHPHEAAYLYLDSTKAAARLGYQPRWDLNTALEKVVTWFKAYGKGEDMGKVTDRQIAEFCAAGDRRA